MPAPADALPALIAPTLGPTSLKRRPWGGPRLARMRAAFLPDDAAPEDLWGESWEFSTLEGSESRALGQGLAELLGAPLPFLAKLIDTERALSIQVHPVDDPATGAPGKEEAWIILDAAPGAAVLAGIREGIDATELEKRARAAWDDADAHGDALIDCLERIEVQRGDVVLVPGRTIHAIQGGILLAEIQQPSDCTYRLFDYGSDRQIHPDEALDTIDVEARPRLWSPKAGAEQADHLGGQHVKLQVVSQAGPTELAHPGTHALVVCVSGSVTLRAPDGETKIEAGDLRLWTGHSLHADLTEGDQLVVGHIPTST